MKIPLTPAMSRALAAYRAASRELLRETTAPPRQLVGPREEETGLRRALKDPPGAHATPGKRRTESGVRGCDD